MKNVISIFLLSLGVLFLTSCGGNGDSAKVGEAGKVAEKSDEAAVYNVDVDESVINWEGYKPGTTHEGTVTLQSGEIHVKDNAIESGNFVLDMSTIEVNDLEGEYKEKLEAHLTGTVDEKRTDFFDTRTYPTAKFEITKITQLDNDPDANTMVYGNLTMKDKSHEVGFKADVDMDGGKLKATSPMFNINRTDWGINFMSKSIMDDAKDNFVNDAIGLKINLVAKK